MGLFLTDPEATIDIGNTIVASDGDISISTEVENQISLTAKSTMNTGAGKTNPAGKAISLAWSQQSTTSTIYVDQNSLISSQGAVSITAEATNSSSTTSSSAVYRDGTVGFAPAFAINETHVTVTIDGQVTAIKSSPKTPAPPPPPDTTFNPMFAVDVSASKVTFSGNPIYQTGAAVALFSELEGTIPGLPEGLYYLIVTSKSNNTYELQFASNYEDALARKFIPFGSAYPTLTNTRTNLAIPVTQTGSDKQQQSLILFSDANGPDGATPLFEEGDSVQFTPAANRFLGYIPTSGQLVELDPQTTYRVKVVESESGTYPLAIQLLDGSNNPLNLFGGSYLQSESGVRYPIGAIDLDQGQIDLRTQTLDATGENITRTPPVVPVTNGQKLVFHSGVTDASATLQDGDSFWAIVDLNDPGVIRLAVSAAQAEAANPAVQEALAHLTATFKGMEIPLTSDDKPSGLDAYQSFSIQRGNLTKIFVFTPNGMLYGNWPEGTLAVKLATDSAESQANEIITAIARADLGLRASYQGNGRIAVGTQTDLSIQSASALRVASIPVDLPIGNFEAGVGLVFLDDPNVIDNLPVVYHSVPGKPMGGLVDAGVYHVYNVPNTNYNPVVPQFILSLMNGVEISSDANAGSFVLRITALDGSSATISPLAWNISSVDLENRINGLALQGISVRVDGTGTVDDPWYIDGVNVEAVQLISSSLTRNGVSTVAYLGQGSPQVLMDSSATDGTFALEVSRSDGSHRKTGDLAWNITAAQLQNAINGLALSGITVRVEGSGTAKDPWLIRGLNPSQVAVDSARLRIGTKPTTMQMTSARQVQFYNGQSMDDSAGTQYPITGADRDNGTLTIMLPDNAPVVSADSSQLISDGTGIPIVTFEAIPIDALEIFSIATGGTFTLTYTDSAGNEHASSDLAFDATTSELGTAISAITGNTVSVTGRGTIGSPWMVPSLNVDQITSESKLVNALGDPTELVAQTGIGEGYRIWIDHAQGGTFRLTLDNTKENVTTTPINFNATANDLNAALRALPGVTAQVTGSGRSDDPWILQTGALPIRTGDPLIFRDSWGMSSLGMIDGRTYYAVVLDPSDDPREITLQLAATREGASGASSDWGSVDENQHIEMRPYLPLEPTTMSEFIGKPVTLSGVPSNVPAGINISAELNASNSIGSYANLGGFPLLSYAAGVNQLSTKKLNKDAVNIAGDDSWIENLIKSKAEERKDQANGFEFVGAAGLQWIDNNVQVVIGRTARIGTDGTLAIHSDINQSLSAVSNAGLSKTNSGNENRAIAVAVAFSNVSNTSETIVSSNAIIGGGFGVDVDSNITYVPPAHWPFIRQVGSTFSKDHQFWKHIVGELETLFTEIFLGDLGLLSANFNTVANVGIARVGGQERNSPEVMKWVWTGSFAYEIIHNNNLAQIADGAWVNVSDQLFTMYDRQTDSEKSQTANLKPKWTGYNETQTVGFAGTIDQDRAKFKLSYDYLSTDWLDWTATDSEIQAALEDLKLIGSGNVEVTKDPSSDWRQPIYIIKFVNALANTNVDQVTIQTTKVKNATLTMYSTNENIPPAYGVSVVAETNTKQWGLAGQLYFSLPYIIHGFFSGEGSGIEKAWREGGLFRSAAENAFGGSVSLLTMEGSTQALLGGYDPIYDPDDPNTKPTARSTKVYYGTGYDGGLEIRANTTNGVVQVAQAAANSSGLGVEGSVAYVAMGEPHATVKPDDRRQITYAKMISRTVPLDVYPISPDSDGDISVVANDQSFGWAITGSILIGQSKGIGLSGSIVELTRDVQASIGSQYNHQQDDATQYYMDPYRTSAESTQQSGSEIHTDGFLTVTSHVGGTIVRLSLVGSGAVRGRGVAASLGDPPGGGSDYRASGNESEIAQLEKGIDDLKKSDGIIGEDKITGRQKRLDELQSKSKENEDVPAKEKEQVPADEGDGSGGDSEVIENGQNSKKGKWGFFISGDFSAAFVTDQVYGYINLDGSIIGNGSALPDDKKTIASGNSTTVNPGAGSFALKWDKAGTDKPTSGFAGSVAWASVDSDVQSVIDGTSVDGMAVTLVAENNKKIGSGAAGFQLDSPTGFDLQVAGSVVINSVSNTTVASLRNSDLTHIAELDVKAYAKDQIYGTAGTAQLSFAPFEGGTVVGVGMSAVWNDTNNTTTAEIVDCPNITQSSGDTQVIAEDFTTSTANSFGVQIAVTKGIVVEIGGMWTTNLLFPNTTAQITGSKLTNTNPNAGTTMLVSATLAPIVDSFAGYFSLGVSTNGSAQVGVGAAVITTRMGNKQEELDDPTDNYQTLAHISDSTIEAYDSVDVYALTGDLNDDTHSYVPDQSESELSDSSKNRYSIRSLAIAGGAQIGNAPVSISAQGSFVSTKTRIATIALVTDSANILQTSGRASNLTVQAINQITAHTDSGGVSAAITFSGSVGIAFGGAVNQYNSFNRTEALVDGSTVNTRNATVSAKLAPFIENIAFGVAISASASVAIGDSGADEHLNQYDSANAGISKSVVSTTGDLKVAAEDETFLKTGSGSGTLAIGLDGAGIAFGGVFNIVRVRNDVLAWIGTKPTSERALPSDDTDEMPTPNIYTAGTLDSSVITVGGSLTITALSGQTIKNTTTAVAVAGSGIFAFAGSGADAKIHLANIVRAGINDFASLTVTGAGSSDSKPGVTVRAEILGVNSNDSVKDRRVYATIGDFAGVGASYGASIGLSFGQITNDDFVVAQIENSIVTVGSDTSGSSIDVSASDSRYMESKVWVTSIAIALGGALAGGHSFIYSQPIVIAEVGHGSQIKPKKDSYRSDLSINATGQESVHAGIFGGVAGVVALGDFIAEADKHGVVGAVLGTVGTLNVGNLTVQALGGHDLDAHGWSLGGGALAISGDGHRLTYDEQIVAWGGGDIGVTNSTAAIVPPSGTTTVNATGNVSLLATSSTKAYSNAGQKPTDDNHSGNWGGVSLGFFHAHATYSPTISTQTINLDLTYGGDLELIAQTDKGSSQSRAVTASDAGFGLDFTKAFNTIEPNATLTINSSTLQAAQNSSGTMSLLATNDMQYDTYAYTFAITIVAGGSGSRVFNSFQPIAIVNYSGTNTLTSAGTVNVVTHNAWKRSPNINDGKSGLYNDTDIYNSSQGLGGGTIAEDASTVGSGTTENTDAEIVQTIGFSTEGEITGGTFTLTYAGQTTTPLDYNAKKEEIESALENLQFTNPNDIFSYANLSGKVKVNRTDSKKEKMQWKITFSEGVGTQQLTIDTSHLQYSGQLSKTENSDTLPWSYDGTSTIDFGTSTTEIKASDSLKPIDVTWLATQAVDLQEFANQKIIGTFGKAYAKSTVALHLDNKILLDNATVTLTSGIGYFTSASAVDIAALSQTSADHPLLGGGTSQAIIVVNATNSYRDNTSTQITANNIAIISGGQTNDWDAINHPVNSDFTPKISATARAGIKGLDYAVGSVINQSNTIDQYSTLKALGDPQSPASKIISTDENTTESYEYYVNKNAVQGTKTAPILFSNSYANTSGTIQFGFRSFDVEVHETGVLVNGKHFDWSAMDPANSVNYQSLVSSSSDPLDRLFKPFVAGRSSTVEAALGEIMDASGLDTFKQNYAVPQAELAYLLQQIEVPQASFKIVADQFRGTGTVSAQVPKLNVINMTSGWLILNGIASHTNRNAGKVLLLDSQRNPTTAAGLTIHSEPNPDRKIDVSVSPPSSSSAKPFMIVAGYLNAPSSDVTLTNNYGPIIELAPILAASVTINVPNSAFAVYTPDSYFGTGGNSMLAFENAAYANALDTNSSANPSSNLPFLPGQTKNASDHTYIDPNYIAPASADYVNGTHTSRIPLAASGPTHVINPQLGAGITAAQIAIFAKSIDINAPLKVGKTENFSVTLSSDLGNQFRNHKAAYESGSTFNPLLVVPNVCQDSPDVTATYDARTHQITLSSMTLSQSIRVLLDGQIVSTVDGSMVQLLGGPGGITQVWNQTGIPLILNNIDAGAANITGSVEFRDTATQINTRYVYTNASDGISVFTTPRGQSYSATPNQTFSSRTIDYQPQVNTRFVSSQRQDIFKATATGSWPTSPDAGWSPTSVWNFGDVSKSGFAEFQTVNAASISSDQKQLTLTTNGTGGAANAAWLQQPIDVTRSFMVSLLPNTNGSYVFRIAMATRFVYLPGILILSTILDRIQSSRVSQARPAWLHPHKT